MDLTELKERVPMASARSQAASKRSRGKDVFPNAACVVSLVDRLIHHAEILRLQGESYRFKEAQERAEQRARKRRRPKSTT
jgi:hypothetical protein